jgi:3-oxoacyl-[acyl-carrier protein] reductase
MKLNELKIIVTGAASGLGAHFARRLSEAGAQVLAVDLSEDGLSKLAAETKVETFRADVSCEAEVEAMTDACVDRFGGINALVNNAGLVRDGLLVKRDKETGALLTLSLADWRKVIDVDLTGPFLCTRAVVARMLTAGTRPGVIVNISSVSRHGNIGQSSYSAAKAGLAADTRVWGKELARHGIRVGAVAPGFVDTPLTAGMRPEMLAKMLDTVPLRRAASTEEIYLGVRFILECDYFTGRCIDLDGGLTM